MKKILMICICLMLVLTCACGKDTYEENGQLFCTIRNAQLESL